jgi:hypothetical protein
MKFHILAHILRQPVYIQISSWEEVIMTATALIQSNTVTAHPTPSHYIHVVRTILKKMCDAIYRIVKVWYL